MREGRPDRPCRAARHPRRARRARHRPARRLRPVRHARALRHVRRRHRPRAPAPALLRRRGRKGGAVDNGVRLFGARAATIGRRWSPASGSPRHGAAEGVSSSGCAKSWRRSTSQRPVGASLTSPLQGEPPPRRRGRSLANGELSEPGEGAALSRHPGAPLRRIERLLSSSGLATFSARGEGSRLPTPKLPAPNRWYDLKRWFLPQGATGVAAGG